MVNSFTEVLVKLVSFLTDILKIGSWFLNKVSVLFKEDKLCYTS